MDDAAYMLDTTVFNDVLDGKIPLSKLEGRQIIVTHIQRDQIRKTTCDSRRNALLKIFEDLRPHQKPTSSGVVGISVVGASFVGTHPDGLFARLLAELSRRDNRERKNHRTDVLIAEAAMRNGCTLITADRNLREAVTQLGGACADVPGELS